MIHLSDCVLVSWMREVAQLEDWDTCDMIGRDNPPGLSQLQRPLVQSPTMLEEVTTLLLAALIVHTTATQDLLG